MGGNQSKISVNTATENLVESIMNTTQKSAINTNISQDVLIDGREYARDQSAKYLACTRDNINKKPNEILEICMPLAPGSIENVTVKGTFDISKSTTLTAKSVQDAASTIANNIKATQEQENSGFSINEKASTNIVSSIKQHSKLKQDKSEEGSDGEDSGEHGSSKSAFSASSYIGMFIGVAIIALLITIIVLNSKNKKDNNVDVKCNNGKCETE